MAKQRKELVDFKADGSLRLNFHQGQTRTWDSQARFIFMLAGTQGGKALAVDTPIPTPTGFMAMGDLRVGDQVFDESGQPCTVTYATEVMVGHDCYEVVFDDGARIVADADHQWLTQTHAQRKNEARRVKNPDPSRLLRPQCQAGPTASNRTTREIAGSLLHFISGKPRANHSIPLPLPAEYGAADLPIPPYTFGAWLGDGYSHSPCLVVGDEEIVEHVRAEGVEVEPVPWDGNAGKATVYRLGHANGKGSRNPFTQLLNKLGVRDNKHIPALYLTASTSQRFSLLQGLMDTDGYCKETGRAEFMTISLRLSGDMMELLRSLGIKGRMVEERAMLDGRDCGARYRITFSTLSPVFRLQRKRERQTKVMGRDDITRRFVYEVRPVPSVPVRCIQVDSPSHLYLAGRDYVVTHNTSFGPWWLWREIELQGSGDYIAATSTFDLFKLKLLPELRRVFEDSLGIGRYWAGDKVIEIADPETGEFKAKLSSDPMYARIILRSAASPGSLESATAKGAWLDEVGQEGFPLEAWEAILRRLSLHEGRVLGTTTLYTIGWLKQQVYDAWNKGDPDFDVIQFASTLNPIFSQNEFERARRTLPEWKFNMFYLGQFTRPPGLIYSDYRDFEAAGHLRKRFAIPAHWPRYVGLDPGGVHLATLWLAHDQTLNVFYAYRESLEGDMTTREHVAKAEERAAGENVVLWAGGAPSEDQVRKDWADAGRHVGKPTVTDVESGLDRVIELFKTYRLYVFDDLTRLRDELGTYSRVLDRTSLEPTDEIKDKNKFHILDALRYVATVVPAAGESYLDPRAGQGENPFGFLGAAKAGAATTNW